MQSPEQPHDGAMPQSSGRVSRWGQSGWCSPPTRVQRGAQRGLRLSFMEAGSG